MNRKHLSASLAVAAAAIGVALGAASPAAAGGSFTWTGEGDGQTWTDACNWWPKNQCQQEYPGSGSADDDAVLAYVPGKTPPQVKLGDDVDLGSFTFTGPASIEGGSIHVTKTFSWGGGTLDTAVFLGGAATGSIDGAADHTLGALITNNGRLTIGATLIKVGRDVGFDNGPTGKLTAVVGARLSGLECCVHAPRVNNRGTFTVAKPLIPTGADTVVLSGVSFNTGGKVNLNGGKLRLEIAPGSVGEGTAFAGNGSLTVANQAVVTLGGQFTVSRSTQLELAPGGRLAGVGTFTGGRFLWTGGRVDAVLTLDGVDTTLDGPDSKDLAGTIASQAGRVNVLQPAKKDGVIGHLRLGEGARFSNQGVFVAREGFGMDGLFCCTNPAEFDNEGGVFSVLRRSDGVRGQVGVANIRFRAAGEVHLESAAFEAINGLVTFADGLRVTGSGSLALDEGVDATLAGNFSAEPNVLFTERGDLDGTGQYAGRMDWLAGTMKGNLTVADTGVLAIKGPSQKYLYGQLTTLGKASVASTNDSEVRFGAGAAFFNAGQLTVGDHAIFAGLTCCVNPPTFVNIGNFRMASRQGLDVRAMMFLNRGTLDLVKGTLSITSGGYSQPEGSTRLLGGTLTSVPVVDIAGGTLVGAGTINGSVRNAGTIAPGPPDVAGSTGIVTILGDYTQDRTGTVQVDVDGTTPGASHDQLRVSDTATLAGRLAVHTADGFSPALGTRVVVLLLPTRNGNFGSAGDLTLPDGHRWTVTYATSDVALVAKAA